MLTRKLILGELHCKACDEMLDDYELGHYKEFDGLCEECYNEAMEAAYEDYNPDEEPNDF